MIVRREFASSGRMKTLHFPGWCAGRRLSSHLAVCRAVSWSRMPAVPCGLVTESGHVGSGHHSYHQSLWNLSAWNFTISSFHWTYVLLSMKKKSSLEGVVYLFRVILNGFTGRMPGLQWAALTNVFLYYCGQSWSKTHSLPLLEMWFPHLWR